MNSPMMYPLFAQIFMTFILLFWMGYLRVSAIRQRKVKIAEIALGQNAWPEHIMRVSNCFNNQLETPVLFYVLILLLFQFRIENLFFTTASWIFVGFRLWHAIEETTRNYVPKRFLAFLGGSLVLLAMWIGFLLQLALNF